MDTDHDERARKPNPKLVKVIANWMHPDLDFKAEARKLAKEEALLDPMLDLKQVMAMTGLSKENIRTQELAGTFPKRLTLSPNRRGWPKSVIEQWVNDKKAETQN